jgi:cytochrome c peroxidase
VATLVLAAACSGGGAPSSTVTTKEQLGALIFTDTALSEPAGQACADCHAAARFFTDPESDQSTSQGAVTGRFGKRNTPSAMYLASAPPRARDAATGAWRGGLFWDGRADTLEAQAAGPLLEPLEMNNPSRAALVAKVRAASYAPAFETICGAGALDDADTGFAHVTEAIAAYERTATFAPFASKYDRVVAGTATFTAAEARGKAIFEDPKRGNCASCHPAPLFTDFSYANLGIPKYMNSRYLLEPAPFNPDGAAFVDHGLMAVTGDAAQDGMFRTPSLRNVGRTGPYGHNGYFENVRYLLDFLDTRDVGSAKNGPWAAPEVPGTIDRRVGNLGLSDQDVEDLAQFLDTLTDDPPPR